MIMTALLWLTTPVDVDTHQQTVLWQKEVATIPAALKQAQAEYEAHPDRLKLATQLLEQYVNQARRDDNHEFINRANQLIENVSAQNDEPQAEHWLLAKADAWQYQHKFKLAQTQLKAIDAGSPFFTRASLMSARIALAVGATDNARSYCNRLMGEAALGIVATCLLEVQGREGQLAEAYNQLQMLHQRSADRALDTKVMHWRLQILTEQALLLRRYSEARNWLSLMPGDLSIVDKKRQLDSYLMDATRDLPSQLMRPCEANVVDSIAIRLALAQKLAEGAGCWMDYTAERIQIRERRSDKLHSADIAYYYTYVAPHPEKAKHWAEINYQVAKEPLDQALLHDAEQLSTINED